MSVKKFFGVLLIFISVCGLLFIGGCAVLLTIFMFGQAGLLGFLRIWGTFLIPVLVLLGIFFLGKSLIKNPQEKAGEEFPDED